MLGLSDLTLLHVVFVTVTGKLELLHLLSSAHPTPPSVLRQWFPFIIHLVVDTDFD